MHCKNVKGTIMTTKIICSMRESTCIFMLEHK